MKIVYQIEVLRKQGELSLFRSMLYTTKTGSYEKVLEMTKEQFSENLESGYAEVKELSFVLSSY